MITTIIVVDAKEAAEIAAALSVVVTRAATLRVAVTRVTAKTVAVTRAAAVTA